MQRSWQHAFAWLLILLLAAGCLRTTEIPIELPSKIPAIDDASPSRRLRYLVRKVQVTDVTRGEVDAASDMVASVLRSHKAFGAPIADEENADYAIELALNVEANQTEDSRGSMLLGALVGGLLGAAFGVTIGIAAAQGVDDPQAAAQGLVSGIILGPMVGAGIGTWVGYMVRKQQAVVQIRSDISLYSKGGSRIASMHFLSTQTHPSPFVDPPKMLAGSDLFLHQNAVLNDFRYYVTPYLDHLESGASGPAPVIAPMTSRDPIPVMLPDEPCMDRHCYDH